MRYWCVNQNQTHRQEIGGGYLWSPKRSANAARNPFYESMREVAPGDLIFSFVNTCIVAIGIAASNCYFKLLLTTDQLMTGKSALSAKFCPTPKNPAKRSTAPVKPSSFFTVTGT